MRLLITLVGLAIGFVMPAFAQTKETVDPQTKAQLDGLTEKFATALDSNDASQMANVFAKDAVYVTNKGPLHGQEEIQNYFADLFKQVHVSDHWAPWTPTRCKFSVPIRCGEMVSGVPQFNCPTERVRLKRVSGQRWKCVTAILGNICF